MKIKYLVVLPIITIFLLSGVSLVHAQNFTNSLYYGLQNNAEVSQLQEFLTAQGLYSGPITGNFYTLTLNAVKAFQVREGISPAAGYFGPLTIAAVNKVTGAPSVIASTTTPQLRLAALEQELALLERQLQAQESNAQAPQTIQLQVQVLQPTLTAQQPSSTPIQIQQNATPTSPLVVMPPSGFSWTPVGATSQRGKSVSDEIADVTFNPVNGGAVALNTMTVTFSGTAASSTGFLSGAKLIDPSGNAVSVSSQTADCNGAGTCSVTFNFDSRLDSGAQTYKVIVDDSKEAVALGGGSVSLYVTIAAPADVSYYDAPSGGSLVNLPAVLQPGNQIFPLTLNSVSYAQGT